MAEFLVTHFIAPDPFDGESVRTYSHWLYRDFPWLFPEHEIVYSGVGFGWRGWRRNGLITSHAGFLYTGTRFHNLLRAWLTNLTDVRRMARRGGCTVLVGSAMFGLGAAVAKRCYGRKVALVQRVVAHDASSMHPGLESRFWSRIFLNIQRFVLRSADVVLPVGPFTTQLALSLGTAPHKLITLPVPVPWEHAAIPTDVPDRPTILYVGRLERGKGVQVLLQALAHLTQQVPDAHLIIVGTGSHREPLTRQATALRMQDHVTFCGTVTDSELICLYRQARVCVMPSVWQEGQGTVLLEAGLMGRPVVASNLGGITDIVQHEENGLLVPAGDAAALAQAILQVLQDRSLAQRLGRAGYRMSKDHLAGRPPAVERVQKTILALAQGRDLPLASSRER